MSARRKPAPQIPTPPPAVFAVAEQLARTIVARQRAAQERNQP